MDIQGVIALISAVVAVASALFAWQAARVAEKAYSVELITSLYSIYHSEEMLKNIRIVWNLYHEFWRAHSDSASEGDKKANEGELIPTDLALEFLLNLKAGSEELNAIHALITFWTYIELLLKKKVLSPEEIVAFTSPRILGFLYPIAKASEMKYGREVTDKSEILKYAYTKLRHTKYFV